MRTVAIALSVLLSLAAGVSQAAPGNARAKEERSRLATEREAMIEKLAQSIFAEADQNHNQLLNKREFEGAQAALESTVAEWGRTRVIGKPPRPNAKVSAGAQEKQQESAQLSAASAKVSTANMAKNNKITSAEFSFYVHAMVDQADRYWAQANAAADAQSRAAAAERKAMADQRRAMKAARRMPRAPVFNPYSD